MDFNNKKEHALCITAYNEFDWLIEQCKVYSDYFKIYIHIDKKANYSSDQIRELKSIKDVTVISAYVINWGSYRHVLAFLDLLRLANSDGMKFYHLISANTILIKHPYKLFDFFSAQPNNNFIEIKKDDGSSFAEFGFRYSAYFFQHLYNRRGKFTQFWRYIECGSALIQRKLKLRSKVKFDYKGYVYCHLNDEAVTYVLDYVKHNPRYLREIKYCCVGEEFFFQNILMNSKFAETVIDDSLIYHEWDKDGGALFFDSAYFDILSHSEALFARKISEKDKDLFAMIREKENF